MLLITVIIVIVMLDVGKKKKKRNRDGRRKLLFHSQSRRLVCPTTPLTVIYYYDYTLRYTQNGDRILFTKYEFFNKTLFCERYKPASACLFLSLSSLDVVYRLDKNILSPNEKIRNYLVANPIDTLTWLFKSLRMIITFSFEIKEQISRYTIKKVC